MQLYYTPNSPYARICRIVAIEGGIMDGIELVKRLRESPRHRDLRLLMICTESDRTRIEQARAVGVDDYLTKPFAPESLARALVGLGVCIRHTIAYCTINMERN